MNRFFAVSILFSLFAHQVFSQTIKEIRYYSEVGTFLLNSIVEKGKIFSETEIRLMKQNKNIWLAEYKTKGEKSTEIIDVKRKKYKYKGCDNWNFLQLEKPNIIKSKKDSLINGLLCNKLYMVAGKDSLTIWYYKKLKKYNVFYNYMRYVPGLPVLVLTSNNKYYYKLLSVSYSKD